MAGVKSINVTNTYPDLDKWHMIDKKKNYEKIYNRYAHIKININEEYNEKFELLNPDYFMVTLTNKDLELLKVNYIFTKDDLNKKSDDNHKYEKIYEKNGYKVFKFNIK